MSQDLRLDSDDAREHRHEAGKGSTAEKTEDYTLRYAPRSYRRWRPSSVAVTALGGMAYLADFAIGAGIATAHGTINALVAIVVAAVVIFITAMPLAYYSARYNLDLDLVTRGSGFGYYGSVITCTIYATYTFIFFALEGSIMAQGLKLGLGIPLWLGYLITTLIIIPLVIFGMNTLTVLQLWTTPIWLLLMIGPVAYLAITNPSTIHAFLSYKGDSGHQALSFSGVVLGAGVVLSLIGQIGEQNDVLRFMPPLTRQNRRSWWLSLIVAGPGWVSVAIIKQAIGVFLFVYALGFVPAAEAAQPVQQLVYAFRSAVPTWLALTLAIILVVLSQIKINAVNAYSGSLAWTNSYSRVTKHYPGRLVFLAVNLIFALALMEGDMFAFLNSILGFYSNCAIAWIVTVFADIVINKGILKISPQKPEFRRTMLYAVNPVGVVSFILSTGLSWAAYFGGLGNTLSSYSPIVAAVVALVVTPLMAVATGGRYYLRRTDDGMEQPRFEADGTPAAGDYKCHCCNQVYERPDVLACPAHRESVICSLCLATDRHKHHYSTIR